jgi:hypothetical protein
MMAAAMRIMVLMGVKEQAALYPNRQGLLTSAFGIAVLTAAMLRMIMIT